MLELVDPDTGPHAAWLRCHREWGPGLHEDGSGLRAGDDVRSAEGFARWVEWLRNRPGTLWWIVEAREVLGGIALRQTAECEGHITGHVGYGIRPSSRGRGIATWALTQVMERAASSGMSGSPDSLRIDVHHVPGTLRDDDAGERLFSLSGSMNRLRLRPRCARSRVTVRWLIVVPASLISNVIRVADHL